MNFDSLYVIFFALSKNIAILSLIVISIIKKHLIWGERAEELFVQ